MVNSFKNKNKGFTLVETMVAITVLVVGTLGPLVIAAQGIASGGYAKDQIIAYYLAQEGVEYIRSVRDTNVLNKVSKSLWLTPLDIPCDGSSGKPGCKLDARAGTTPTACSSSTGCGLLKVTNSGYYGYSGSNTVYTRTIKLIPGSTTDIETIQVTMNWTSRGSPRSLTLSEDLYNSL
jgi:prepilin-type N-terminal cleavage/methylation domain-containing protein